MEPCVPQEELAVGSEVNVSEIDGDTLFDEFLLYDFSNLLSQFNFLGMFRAGIILVKFLAKLSAGIVYQISEEGYSLFGLFLSSGHSGKIYPLVLFQQEFPCMILKSRLGSASGDFSSTISESQKRSRAISTAPLSISTP